MGSQSPVTVKWISNRWRVAIPSHVFRRNCFVNWFTLFEYPKETVVIDIPLAGSIRSTTVILMGNTRIILPIFPFAL